MLILKVALPSTTIKLDIALTKVSTVEIVKANPRIIIIRDNISVCSLSNKVKNPRSGLVSGLIEKATIPVKPIKNTIGTIRKKDIIKLFFKVLKFFAE